MFKRAVAAHAAKSREAPDAPPVGQGIEQIVCSHCGAPRQDEERICRYCNQRI